jgi:hypothetical protein
MVTLYFIAMDKMGHFSPIVRQAAVLCLRNAQVKLLWNKLRESGNDKFTSLTPSVFIAPVMDVEGKSNERKMYSRDEERDQNSDDFTALAAALILPDSSVEEFAAVI